ncbi:hypothetical protein MMC22_010494 [Lobaria immixta]|nr:hypothetical protein [Lobaria immixta]
MPLADRCSYRAIEGQAMRQRFQHRLREDVRAYIEMNISNAYLERKLEEIYTEIPEGMDEPDKENHDLLLRRGLYGLKQSDRI